MLKNKIVRDALGRFVSPKVVKAAVKKPAKPASTGKSSTSKPVKQPAKSSSSSKPVKK